MKQISSICLAAAAFLLMSCSPEQNPAPQILWEDFKARRELKNEKSEEALNRYIELLESDSNRYGTHSNIGVLLNKMQKPEEALKALQHALQLAEKQEDAQGVFTLHYNLGVYYGALKKVPEALTHYQAALELQPASTEIKTNIELLIQQQQQDQKQDKKDKEGQGQGQNASQSENNKDQKPGEQGQDKKEENKENPENKDEQKKQEQPRENSAKYKPRPFKGDELSEGDVKKILGELKNQEQKIRANFEKKEKGKSKKNEKDW